MRLIPKNLYFFGVFLLIWMSSFCQELPPIQIFNPEDYQADNQNWMISQADDKYIYVANNKGLLEFNGAAWQVYPSPNNTIIRSVKVIGDRIYTGCYMEFGYWRKNSHGKLEYSSLVNKLEEEMMEDEQIWHIIPHNEWVIFQSFNKIYFYNTIQESFKVIRSQEIIFNVFEIDNNIYYNVRNEGLYKVENGTAKIFISDPEINAKRIINLFKRPYGFLLLTREAGFYLYENETIKKWHTEVDFTIEQSSIFNGVQLSDGNFVLGTISNGIVNLHPNGKINYHITQKNGLSNNTALALFEDADKNLWIGLDNGINCVNVSSPIKVFNDFDGKLGAVYCSKIFDGNLYLGTNQGLFYKTLNSKDSFEFVEGTAGQVWDLFSFNNEVLLCGHHLGTFSIQGSKATLADNELGAWTFRTIPGKERLLLRGNYRGLYMLELLGASVKVRNKIEGFDNSARSFEIDSSHTVWVGHEYKGVFKLELDKELRRVEKESMEASLSLGKNSSIAKYNNELLYAYENGIFRYDGLKKEFEYDSILSPIIAGKNYNSGKLIVDEANKLWAFSKDNIYYITNDHLANTPKVDTISILSNYRKMILGYENIAHLQDKNYLLGTSNGYLTIDIGNKDVDSQYHIYLDLIRLKDKEGRIQYQEAHKRSEFEYNQGVLLFNYAVPDYNKYHDIKYQYLLEGHMDRWSDWMSDAEVQFENLSFGEYKFEVRAKIGNAMTSNTASYSFTIHRPWYVSNLALFTYFLFLFLFAIVVHRTYKRYYLKQLKHKQIESEQMIMQIKNEQLNNDIESKNRELTISKMSIIKKNELLNAIKKELYSAENRQSQNVKSVIKLIDENLNNTKDWEVFVKAFNSTDKGFLDRLKTLHPDLTPNDLRFCVYLRMNLSSKEIAPLLNISVKSVETKRYRLRKRMRMLHEESLVNYIMDI